MLEVNEFLVLDAIRALGRTTRLALVEELDLSPATISRAVTRLIAQGLVSEDAGRSDRSGRPRAVISFNQSAGAVIAVNVGAQWCRGVVTDLAGDIRGEHAIPTAQAGSAYASLLTTIRALQRIASESGLGECYLSVSVPATLDLETGEVIEGPNISWDHFDLAAQLRVDVGLPVTVENEAKLTALAHAWRGLARGLSDFVVLSIGTGVGGAVVANSALLKGAHNVAGEIGYLEIERAQVGRPLENRRGGLEAVLAGPSIASRAAALVAADPTSILAEAEDLTARAVFDAARIGDPVAVRVVEEVLDHVAMAVIAFSSVIDPARVILDGAIGRGLAPYTDAIRERVTPRLPRPPEIVASRLEPSARVLGAIAAGLQLSRRSTAPAASFSTFRAASRAGALV